MRPRLEAFFLEGVSMLTFFVLGLGLILYLGDTVCQVIDKLEEQALINTGAKVGMTLQEIQAKWDRIR